MKVARAEFVAGLERVRQYMEHIDSERRLVTSLLHDAGNTLRPDAKEALTARVATDVVRREFEYRSIVVALYGLIEQLVEAGVSSFIEHQNQVSARFADLPEALRNNFQQVAMSLLNRLEQTRFRDRLTAKSIIASMHACHEGHASLLPEAFVLHTSNVRSQMVSELLSRLGSQGFQQRLERSPRIDAIVDLAPGKARSDIANETTSLVDDLAVKRNEVAHGAISTFLGNSALLPYVAAVEAFGLAVCDELVLLSLLGAEPRGIYLGSPIKVINNQIVCVSVTNGRVRRGDYLLVRTANNIEPFKQGEILEIQVDNLSVEEVVAPPMVNAGLRVCIRCKDNQTYTAVPRELVI